ncbi:hypothetical protein [Mycoplasmopsis lipofaciens]|uniref:hypothetical protein n=1 Tax=Mycoplasmopsis lipofaciens TaxID=114884 RepID=UPI00048019E3|nr:hypothetical protein [Mycoplasmopsis lipofaciens]
MSHSVVLTLGKEICEKEIFDIFEEKKTNINKIASEINNKNLTKILNHELSKLESELIHDLKGEIVIEEISRKELIIAKAKDKLLKKISNLISNIDLLSQLNEATADSINLSKWIQQYGSIVSYAINNIRENNVVLNDKNLGKEIDNLLEKEAILQEKEKFKLKIRKWLDSNIKSEKIKFLFLKEMEKIKIYQEMSDFLPYLEDKKQKIIEAQNVIKTIYSELKKQNYLMKISECRINDNGRVELKYYFKNKKDEDFEILIDDLLRIEYKIGDYKSHCCEKTSNEIFKALKQNNYLIRSQQITRNINNFRPLYKAKNKVRSK